MTKEENIARLEKLKSIVLSMPEKPGSYQYYDSEGTIIYVGKAKNLKRRVSSYFHKEVDRFKTKVLVSKIHNITYTVVNTEEDALLLENSLIKKYNPRYNVLLKDGKTYPSIVVTNELFPRIFKTRQINRKFGTFYGPSSHIGSMYTILQALPPSYLQNAYNTRRNRAKQIQGLFGIPYKELWRALHQQAVLRRISGEYPYGKGDSERKHPRTKQDYLRADDAEGRGNEVRRGRSIKAEIPSHRPVLCQERSSIPYHNRCRCIQHRR